MIKDTPLNVTQEANHRVFVGLGWDPNDSVSFKDKAMNKLGLKDIHHDLDLACYIFDHEGEYIAHVSADADKQVDSTGKIYHSGDNVEGIGDGDDEQISVEFKGLDPVICGLVFLASIKSGQKFSGVNAPEIRLADGYSGHTFVHVDLKSAAGNDQNAFVFLALIKGADGAWNMRPIHRFTDTPSRNDGWAAQLKGYIS